MKIKSMFNVITITILIMFVAVMVYAQNPVEKIQTFSLTHSAISSGGVSSGEQFTVQSAVGQPVADDLQVGNFSMSSGFLSMASGGSVGEAEFWIYMPMIVK